MSVDVVAAGVRLCPVIDRVCRDFPVPALARVLVLATCAVEGEYTALRQTGYDYYQVGGAWGICQIEEASISAGVRQVRRSEEAQCVVVELMPTWMYRLVMYGAVGDVREVVGLPCAVSLSLLLCRLHYLRVAEALPVAASGMALWSYYKRWYNSLAGAATEGRWSEVWNRLVIPVCEAAGWL
jgi:hypothetical protein